jgi:tetratricopeptide (TPR) repeat protein
LGEYRLVDPAQGLEIAPELTLEDLADIKIPLDLFARFPLDLCAKHRLLPLRLDESSGTLSFLFVDPEVEETMLALKQQNNWKFLSAFRISSKVFDILFEQIENSHQNLSPRASKDEAPAIANETSRLEKSWAIALIEPESTLRSSLRTLLESQNYAVIPFENEAAFKSELQRLSQNLQNEDDLLNIAENEKLVPFKAVMVRKQNLSTPSTFCDYVWAHFNHVKVSILDDRWLTGVLDRGLLENQPEVDDFGFHLRHGNYYYAAIECLKKGNIFQAVELLSQVGREDVHYIKAKILLGKALLKKNNYKKALDHFQEAYDFWADDPEGIVDETTLKLLYHLAYTFEKVGRIDDALKLYERVAAENPLFREVSERIIKVKNKRSKMIKDSERKMGMPAFSKDTRSESRYEKLEEIGKGGMGLVYRARDRVLGREVALKILNSHFKHDEKIKDTFFREAKSLAALNHLNIVTVFDAGIEDGNYYIAMEFIDGRTVRELLKKKGYFKLTTAQALCRQVLKALAYAHSKHVIHRDITTNNMMLTETKVVKLMDFGLARVVNHLHSEQSIIGGTPYFMSPEQVEGAPIDHRTDIYSFGVCFFEMLTGRVPFPMENPGYHHLHSAPPDPRTLKADIPLEMAELILRCLEKDPAKRFQSADEILDLLREAPRDATEKTKASKARRDR